MKFKQRFIAYLLIFIVTFSTVFGSYSQSVYAGQEVGWEIVEFILAHGGMYCIGSDELAQKLYNKYKDSFDAIPYTQNTNGTITFSEEALHQMEALFEQYLEETPEAVDVLWFPTIASDQVPASLFKSIDLYNRFRSLADTTEYSFVMPCYAGMPYFGYVNASDIVIASYSNLPFSTSEINFNTYITTNWGNDTTTCPRCDIRLYDKSGESVALIFEKKYTDSSEDANWGQTSFMARDYPFCWNGFSKDPGYWRIVRGCNTDTSFYFPYFCSINAYKDWITGSGSYYRFDSGYQGGDITINPNADYSTITDAIKNALQQSIRAGQSVTNALSAMQKAFREELAKISGTIGDIEDNTEQTNSWLEKIYNLLQQIYDLMQTQHDELTAYFESANTAMEELPAKMAEAFQGFYDGLTELLHQARDDIVASTDQIGENTKETNTWLEKIHDLIQKLQDILQKMSEFLQKQYDDLTAYFKSAKEAAAELPAKMADAFRGFFKDIIDEIKRARDDIVDTVKDIDFSGSVDETPDENGDTVWTKLGRGLAKILTAVLNLLKLIIFKGLDALDYLIGLLNENVDAVFLNIESYFERVNLLLPESDSAPVILTGVLPKEIRDVMVVCVFMVFVGIVVQQVRK